MSQTPLVLLRTSMEKCGAPVAREDIVAVGEWVKIDDRFTVQVLDVRRMGTDYAGIWQDSDPVRMAKRVLESAGSENVAVALAYCVLSLAHQCDDLLTRLDSAE